MSLRGLLQWRDMVVAHGACKLEANGEVKPSSSPSMEDGGPYPFRGDLFGTGCTWKNWLHTMKVQFDSHIVLRLAQGTRRNLSCVHQNRRALVLCIYMKSDWATESVSRPKCTAVSWHWNRTMMVSKAWSSRFPAGMLSSMTEPW